MEIKTKENFDKYYEDEYCTSMKRYYREIRKKIIPKSILRLIAFTIIIVASVLVIRYTNVETLISNFTTDTKMAITIYFSVLVIFCLLSIYMLARKEFGILGETIIRDMMFFFSDTNPKTPPVYYANKRVGDDALNEIDLFNFNLLKCSGGNYTYIQYDGKMTCFSDLQFYQLEDREKEIYKNGKKYIKKWKERKFIFDGIYIGFPLNQKNSSQIYLVPNNLKYTLLQSRLMDYINYQGDPIKLDNQEFSKKYKVFSYNEEQTKQILSSGLMEKINKLDELYKEKKYIIFKEGTRFSICIDGIKLQDIKEDIKLPVFRMKWRELRKLNKVFDKISNLFMIYHVLGLGNKEV